MCEQSKVYYDDIFTQKSTFLVLLVFSVADFPAGNVRVTMYSNGVPVSTAQLQYYSSMEEFTHLLSRVADPVEFMCQVEPLKDRFTPKNTHIVVVYSVFTRTGKIPIKTNVHFGER